MNAPETIPTPINSAHEVLLKSDIALCVEDVARAIVGKKPTKADIKSAAKLLKEIADLGMIEMEPRTGGVPFYRLIVASESVPKTLRAMIEEHEANDAGESQWLAPEDYEMPPADPVLLAMANKMLGERLEGVAHALRGCGLPGLADATGAEDLQPKVAGLAGAYQMALADLREKEQRIDSLTKDVINTRTALTKAINEADRLRRDLTDSVRVVDSAVGYLVKVQKRKPRYVTRLDRAQDAALAAVRAGAGRAEVLAVVPVGVARRGAEWRGSNPMGKGD